MTDFQELQQRLALVLNAPFDANGQEVPPNAVIDTARIAPVTTKSSTFVPPAMWKQIARAANNQSIISAADINGDFTYVNENFLKISKYSHAELIGAPHSMVRSDHHSAAFFERLWQVIQSGKIWQGTIKNKAKDGSHFWVKTLILPILDKNKQVLSYVSVRNDVTNLVKMASQQKRLDLKSRSVQSLKKLYNIERTGRDLSDILFDAMGLLFEAPWLKVLEKGGVFLANCETEELELTASYKMGPQIESLCSKIQYGHCLCGRAARSKQPIFASCIDERHEISFDGIQPHGHYNMPIMVGEELIGVLVVYLSHGAKHDPDEEDFLADFSAAFGVIISFKRREDELLAEKQKAEVVAELANTSMLKAQSAEQAQTNFLATMSHELRTPLNGIVGMLHVVGESALGPQQREDIGIAMSSANMLLNLINDILDFSKLEYGSMKIEYIPVDIEQLTKDSMTPLLIAAKEKGLQLSYKIADGFPDFCLGDPTRLRQISTNLVGNAIKFTDQGSICVITEFCDTPIGKPDGLWAITKVIDTGIGISSSAQDSIFDRFSQADDSITRQFGGTGLGLAICKELVELMNGVIGVESEEGKGTCFWYQFPVVPVTQAGKRIS